jgi:hypothetical protein
MATVTTDLVPLQPPDKKAKRVISRSIPSINEVIWKRKPRIRSNG